MFADFARVLLSPLFTDPARIVHRRLFRAEWRYNFFLRKNKVAILEHLIVIYVELYFLITS